MRCTYRIPIQQEAIYESPHDAHARRSLDLLLHARNFLFKVSGERLAQLDVLLFI